MNICKLVCVNGCVIAMRKFISLLLVLSCLICCVSAAEEYDNWVQVLDYATANNSGSNGISFDLGTGVGYDLPFSIDVQYVDILFYYSGTDLTSIDLSINGEMNYDLPLVSVGSNMYRCRSAVNSGTAYDASTGFYFYLGNSSMDITYCEFLSFRVCRGGNFIFNLYGTDIEYSLVDDFGLYQSGDIRDLESIAGLDGTLSEEVGYQVAFTFNDWKKYDSIEFTLKVSGSVSSVAVFSNTRPIPFTVVSWISPKDSTDPSYSISGVYDESTGSVQMNTGTSFKYGQDEIYLVLSVDTSELTNSSSGPRIVIDGTYDTKFGLQLSPVSSFGYVFIASDNPVTYWLQYIGHKFDAFWYELFGLGYGDMSGFLNRMHNEVLTFLSDISRALNEGLLNPDTSRNDVVSDEMSSQATEVQDAVDNLDQVTKPAIEDINVSLDEYVSSEDMSPVTAIFATGLSNEFFAPLVMITLTLSLASYVIFGKR